MTQYDPRIYSILAIKKNNSTLLVSFTSVYTQNTKLKAKNVYFQLKFLLP
jgi:hypothetical protein